MHKWARCTCPMAWWEGRAVTVGGRRWWCQAGRRWWWCLEVQEWAQGVQRGRGRTPDQSPTLTLFSPPHPPSQDKTPWVKGFSCFLACSFFTCLVSLTLSRILAHTAGLTYSEILQRNQFSHIMVCLACWKEQNENLKWRILFQDVVLIYIWKPSFMRDDDQDQMHITAPSVAACLILLRSLWCFFFWWCEPAHFGPDT